MLTTWLPFISALNPQPTPQYAQVVMTLRSGRPSLIKVFSCSEPGRARLHAGAAADAFAVHERLILPGRDARLEAAATDRQRKRALRFLARAHAAIADDALGRVVREVRVGLVFRVVQVMRAAVLTADAVAHVRSAPPRPPFPAARSRRSSRLHAWQSAGWSDM